MYTVKIWDTVCVAMCTPATCYKPLVTSRESRKGEGLVDKGKENGVGYTVQYSCQESRDNRDRRRKMTYE